MSTNKLPAEAIQEWLVIYMSKLLKTDPGEIDTRKPFKEFGLDSLAGLGMLGDLSDFIGSEEVEASVLYKYTTIEKLSNHLSSKY